jgi:hypothetical protein
MKIITLERLDRQILYILTCVPVSIHLCGCHGSVSLSFIEHHHHILHTTNFNLQ